MCMSMHHVIAKCCEGHGGMQETAHTHSVCFVNCRNSETCSKKEKISLHDHLEYLLVQNPLSDQHKDHT